MNFFYEATDSTGQTVMGRLDGANEAEVRVRLQQMGYRPQAVALNPGSQTLQGMPAQQPGAVNPGSQTLQALPARQPGAGSMTQTQTQSQMPAAQRQTISRQGPTQAAASQVIPRTGGIILSGNAARTVATASQAAGLTGFSAQRPQPADVSNVGGVNDRDRLFFFQQLASLVKSGMTIFTALDNLGPRTQNRGLAQAATEMADKARNGGRVSDVMERYPRIFEEHIVGLVRAGELGGFLEIVLSEIALNYEQNLALFKGAWIPKMMVTQGLYALALAIPAFPDILANASLDAGVMPGVRLYLMHEAILLPLTFLLIQLAKVGWTRAQLPQWRRMRDEWTLRMPPFGDLHRQAALAAFIRMLRRLYHAGVGPVHAWEGAMQTASNVVIRERLAASNELIQRGVSLPEAFSATGLFNNNMEQLLLTGQLSGQVVESLDQIAEFYQERVEESAERSRKAMFRMGRVAMLILAGITVAWLAHSCYAGTFSFVDKNFNPDIITLSRG